MPALPKIFWALWLDENNRAAKRHLALDVKRHMPIEARITHGNANEKNIVREFFLKANTLYVLDAGYAEYKFFQDILNNSSSFIVRIKDNAVWEKISSNQITNADKKIGVTKDVIVKLGSKSKQNDIHGPVRIIEIFHKGDSPSCWLIFIICCNWPRLLTTVRQKLCRTLLRTTIKFFNHHSSSQGKQFLEVSICSEQYPIPSGY